MQGLRRRAGISGGGKASITCSRSHEDEQWTVSNLKISLGKALQSFIPVRFTASDFWRTKWTRSWGPPAPGLLVCYIFGKQVQGYKILHSDQSTGQLFAAQPDQTKTLKGGRMWTERRGNSAQQVWETWIPEFPSSLIWLTSIPN